MSMFDTIFIAQSLIEKAVEGSDVVLESFEGYHNFQTKDLDNFLTSFYIEDDGSFLWKKQDYEYKEQEPDPTSKRGWMSGLRMVPVGDPQMISDTRSAYIEFYDSYATEKERLFVTFTAHVKNGSLVEPIALKSVERTNLEEERIRTQKIRAEWLNTESTWQWQLATFISGCRWKITKFLNPFNRRLDTIEKNLRDKAKTKFKHEK